MIDWNALGTWAAVLVALGISLKETRYRQRERSTRHLLVVGEILPAIHFLHGTLRKLSAEFQTVVDSESLASLVAAVASYESVMADLSLEPWQPRLEQPDSLPEHLLIPLCKSLTIMRMLRRDAECRPARDTLGVDDLRDSLIRYSEQSESICRSLGWVIQHSERMLNSRRWRYPEVSAGYAILGD